MIRGAIFDVDGTLLNSMMIWDNAPERYLKKKGLCAEEGLADILFSMTMKESAEYFKEKYKISESTETISSEINEIVAEFYKKEVQPKPGVLDFLKELKERKIPMTVATSTDRWLIEMAFQRLDMEKYFDKIFTCTEVGFGKSQPDIFFAASTFMNTIPQDTWVFEDGLYSIQTANRAGYRTVGIYDESSQKDQEMIKKTAEEYLTDFQQRKQLWKKLIKNEESSIDAYHTKEMVSQQQLHMV